MAIGATGDTVLAFEEGKLTALEGRALGIHIAYAPVLDVNNNPANPVINTRSFGEDPHVVARLGAAFIRGLQSNGMIATGKHFPGHGDTEVNSHLALPVVTVSRSRLDSVELVPFQAAVQQRCRRDNVVPWCDARTRLSRAFLERCRRRSSPDLLRNELRFKGIIISDAMDMRGVLDQYGAVEAVKRAVEAGVDVLIQPLTIYSQTIDAVVAGVTEGRYTEARLDQSVRRILAAKGRLGLDRSKLVDLERAAVCRWRQCTCPHGATDCREIHNAGQGFARTSDPIGDASDARVLSVTVGTSARLVGRSGVQRRAENRLRQICASEFLDGRRTRALTIRGWNAAADTRRRHNRELVRRTELGCCFGERATSVCKLRQTGS